MSESSLAMTMAILGLLQPPLGEFVKTLTTPTPLLIYLQRTYGVGSKPNTIMVAKNWSFERLVPAFEESSLDRAIDDVGSLADEAAITAVHHLVALGWLRQVREWQLTEIFAARTVLNDHGWCSTDPSLATLVMLNGNTTATCRYLEWERQQSNPQAKLFGVVPYGRSLTQALLSEYRLNVDHRSLVRYGRQKHGDVTVPYLTQLMPHGSRTLSSLSIVYDKPRAWLLSFVGSAYRPSEPAMTLSYERYPVLLGLMRLEVKYEREGVAAFKSARLRANVAKLSQVKGLLSRKGLFIAPMTRFPKETGLNDVNKHIAKRTRLLRRRYSCKQHVS